MRYRWYVEHAGIETAHGIAARRTRFVDALTWPPLVVTVLVLAANTIGHTRYAVLTPRIYMAVWAVAFAALLASFGAHLLRRDKLAIRCALIVAAAGVAGTVNKASSLIRMLSAGREFNGADLLQTGLALWAVNILIFSLLYWTLDRGGPYARKAGVQPSDWLFPEMALPGTANRTPVYLDFFCLSFNTATAFSPTDVVTLSTRARLVMVVESAISLAIVAIIAARALNMMD